MQYIKIIESRYGTLQGFLLLYTPGKCKKKKILKISSRIPTWSTFWHLNATVACITVYLSVLNIKLVWFYSSSPIGHGVNDLATVATQKSATLAGQCRATILSFISWQCDWILKSWPKKPHLFVFFFSFFFPLDKSKLVMLLSVFFAGGQSRPAHTLFNSLEAKTSILWLNYVMKMILEMDDMKPHPLNTCTN